MPRCSQRRSHKHSSDRSDSEEGGSLRERKTRDEEAVGSSGLRVSWYSEPENRDPCVSIPVKRFCTVGTEMPRARRSVKTDRRNGGNENDEKWSKGEDFGQLELDKSSAAKATDSKSRSSRKYDGANDRDEDRGRRNDSTKGKSEKVSSQREVTYHYRDGKERDNNKDQEVHDLHSRKHCSRAPSSTEELASKRNAKFIVTKRQVHDVLPSAEIEKRPEKHTRRDDNEDRDKRYEDFRDFDDRRLSSRDHSRNRSYKDERHANIKYKGKYKIDNDRDQNHCNDKNQDEWSSKDYISDKSYKFRDENRLQERDKKTKLQDTDQDGTYVDVVDTKLKDRRKRYSDEKIDISDLKLRGVRAT